MRTEMKRMTRHTVNWAMQIRTIALIACSSLIMALVGCATMHEDNANPLTGEWNWFSGEKVVVKPDGTFAANHSRFGTVEVVDKAKGMYRLTWDNGAWVDTLTLDKSGTKLEGKNNAGHAITGSRIK